MKHPHRHTAHLDDESTPIRRTHARPYVGRRDVGEALLLLPLITFGVTVTVAVCGTALTAQTVGEHPWAPLAVLAASAAASVAIGWLVFHVITAVVAALSGRRDLEVLRQNRRALETSLRAWTDMPATQQIGDQDLRLWRAYLAAGLTEQTCRQWSARGYGPGVAAAAGLTATEIRYWTGARLPLLPTQGHHLTASADTDLNDVITPGDVDDLARLLHETGVWGGDQRDLDTLIGWDTTTIHRWHQSPTPVLRHWLRLRSHRIRDELAQAQANQFRIEHSWTLQPQALAQVMHTTLHRLCPTPQAQREAAHR